MKILSVVSGINPFGLRVPKGCCLYGENEYFRLRFASVYEYIKNNKEIHLKFSCYNLTLNENVLIEQGIVKPTYNDKEEIMKATKLIFPNELFIED